MATRVEEVREAGGWEPVPPGHPDRAAFEERVRELGIRPATGWEPRLDRPSSIKPRWRDRFMDAARRVWYGPAPAPLTDEEMQMIMRPRDEDDDLPERVPPDDPERLAWEAELRAIGVRPARKWNFPIREPLRRPSAWQRIKYRISLGW